MTLAEAVGIVVGLLTIIGIVLRVGQLGWRRFRHGHERHRREPDERRADLIRLRVARGNMVDLVDVVALILNVRLREGQVVAARLHRPNGWVSTKAGQLQKSIAG